MAGGGKESPRQKMIGMMYLVLTALLAMNVSKQVLQGYISVNKSMEDTKKNLTENNKNIYEAFEKSISGNAAAKPYFERAKEAKKYIDEMYKYINETKNELISHVEGVTPEVADTFQMRFHQKFDDYDVPTHVMIGSDKTAPHSEPHGAVALRKEFNKLSDNLIALIEKMQKNPQEKFMPEEFESLKKKFAKIKPVDSGREDDGIKLTWELEHFDHLPNAAAVANLNKFQSELRNLEAEILQTFAGASGKLAIKFDAIKARVVAPSSYIQAGQQYEADIFLAASSSKLAAGDMEVLIGVDSLGAVNGAKGNAIEVVAGEGKYKAGTSGAGDQTYKGVIKFKTPDGTFKYYPFEQSYKVAPPAVSVSADQMNVFYAGVPNPVTAAAAGIAPADISVTASGAGVNVVSKGPGKYEFNFSGTGECMVTVSAKLKEGVKPQGPPVKFRVKPLPKPDIKIGGKFLGAEIKKADLQIAAALGAGALGFDFQANYVVLNWEILCKVKGKTVQANGTGPMLSDEAKKYLKDADVGGKLYIDAKVKGPDGKPYPVTTALKVAK